MDIEIQKKQLLEETLKELEFATVIEKIKKYCYSDGGIEQISNHYPMDSRDWLQKEHQLIDELRSILTEDEELPIDGLNDIRNKLHKSLVQNAILSPVDLLSVRDTIRVSRLVKRYFELKNEKYPSLFEESEGLHHNRLLEKHISDAIDDNGEVRDTATAELARLRRMIFDKSARLRSKLQKILKKVVAEDLAQEDFYSVREGRFVLPVKSEHKRHIPGIIHGVSQTGSTVFLEPSEIIEMNNELSLLHNDEKREIYKILQNLTAEIGHEAHLFLRSIAILSHLDAIRAKALYSLEYGGIKPVINEERYISLKDIRHPILTHSKGRKDVVPMSIEFTDKIRGHLISGPNAGGKTVALKSIGLNILMALSGIYPIGYVVTDIRNVYSAIGDHQSIENDLSTFSSQILKLKKILDACDNSSILLIDEIGSGTDPQEGSALAAGLLDTFINLGAFFIATTHQSSLKTYALNRNEIKNASLEFDQQKLKPTYTFISGLPGNSYAFILAKNLGISDLVLQRAKSYLGDRQSELEKSISILGEYRNKAEKEYSQIANYKKELEKQKAKYQEKYDIIKDKRAELLDKAKEEASDIVSNANALIEKTIKEIKEEKKAISDIKKDFEQGKQKVKDKISAKPSKSDRKSEKLKIGDLIFMTDAENTGVIEDIDYDSKSAVCNFNGIKFLVKFHKLTKAKVSKEIKKNQSPRKEVSDYIDFGAKSSIDIRGSRAEEALRAIDEFLSGAILGNINSVTVIHGKGTGALRKAIHDYLKHYQSVKSFRSGEIVEGGDGVTIIELHS